MKEEKAKKGINHMITTTKNMLKMFTRIEVTSVIRGRHSCIFVLFPTLKVSCEICITMINGTFPSLICSETGNLP